MTKDEEINQELINSLNNIPVKGEKEESIRPNYKGKFKNEQGLDRTKRIKSCVTCKGNPKKVNFTLKGQFKGERCETCFEVINYKKI